MKIGILSDTHDQVPRTRQAVRLFQDHGVNSLVHCGDLTIPEVAYECACEGIASHFVMGNCDWDRSALRHAIETIGGVYWDEAGELMIAGQRVAVTHGHLSSLWRKILQSKPDYLLHGHTHIQEDRLADGVRIINPGALYRASHWTAAILDLETRDLRFLKIT